MNHCKLVSVIVPMYEVEQYIGRCLDSLVSQTYHNLEIIVVNDGSRDRSAEIAKGYADKDIRVKVFDYENAGVSVARNRGLAHATGDYIAFVDSDDWLALDCYEKLVNAMEKYDVDIVKCGAIETDLYNEERISFPSTRVRPAIFDLYFQGFLWTVVWNALYKRDIVIDVQYPIGIVHEDNYISGIYLNRAKHIMEIKDNLYYYRKNFSGISKGRNKRPLDKAVSMSLLKSVLENEGFKDKRIDWRIAVEIFHFVRNKSPLYRVKTITESCYDYVKQNLDLRRKIQFMLVVWKKNIKLI